MTRFVLFLLLMFVSAVGVSFIVGADVATWLPMGISILALLISLMSAFRAEILPVDLVVSGGDLILSPPKIPGELVQITLALNLSFLNKGYGEDVVEWVGLRLKGKTGVRDFIPVAEVDLAKVLGGLDGDGKVKKIHATNSTAFTSFALHAKSSLTKTIVFAAKDGPQCLELGDLEFRVYVKLVSRGRAQPVHSVTHSVDQSLLDFVGRGNLSLTQSFEVVL